MLTKPSNIGSCTVAWRGASSLPKPGTLLPQPSPQPGASPVYIPPNAGPPTCNPTSGQPIAAWQQVRHTCPRVTSNAVLLLCVFQCMFPGRLCSHLEAPLRTVWRSWWRVSWVWRRSVCGQRLSAVGCPLEGSVLCHISIRQANQVLPHQPVVLSVVRRCF